MSDGELFAQLEELPGLLGFGAGRLLTDHMLARPQGVPRDGIQQRDRQRDEDRLDVVAPQQIVIVRVVVPHVEAGRAGERLGFGSGVVGEGDHLEAIAQLPQGRPMELLNGQPGTDHAEPHRARLRISGHVRGF